MFTKEQEKILKNLGLSKQDFYDIFGGKKFIEEHNLTPRFKEDAPEGTVLKVTNGKKHDKQITIVYIFGKNGFEVFIDGFYLPKDLQGKGTLTFIFASLIAIVSKLGYKFFTAKLGRDNFPGEIGYYVWPRLGYNGLNKSPKFESIKKKYATETKLSNAVKSKIISAKDVIDLCSFPEGRECWKHIGRTFDAEFDLAENSKSMKTFKKHLKKYN